MLGLAGQAAVAIDNASLFETAQRANQMLEQRVEERTHDLQAAHEACVSLRRWEPSDNSPAASRRTSTISSKSSAAT